MAVKREATKNARSRGRVDSLRRQDAPARRQYQRKSSQSKPAKTKSSSSPASKNLSCPIVGIGGSAGGFEAAMELLRHLPSRTGMAFVIVQHLDPHHGSRLPNLLGKATSMPVTEVTETITTQPHAIYVQPPITCVSAN